MIWIGTHLLGLLLLIGIAYGSGELLRRRFFGPLDTRLRHLTSLCLGLALWTLIPVTLAALQLLSAGAVLGCLALGALAGLWRLRRSQRSEPSAAHQVTAPSDTAAPSAPLGRQDIAWLAALCGLVLAPIAALALAPTISWDAAAYHLTVPRLYLEHGGFRPVELNVYSNWPLGTEMLYAMGLLLQDHVLPKLMHFAFGLALLYAVFLGLRSVDCDPLEASDRTLGGALAMAFVLANGVVVFEMRVAYVDLAVGFYLLAAFLFLRRWQRTPQHLGALVLAGISCGLMAGSKLNGFVGIFALAWLLMPTVSRLWRERGWKAANGALVAFASPILLLWSPWLVKSIAYTGNPLYPALYGIFGGPDWSPQLATQLSTWQQGIGMGRQPLDYLLLPWRIIVHGGSGYERFDGSLSLVWLLILPLALWRCRRSAVVRQPLAVATLFFVSWVFTSQQLRLLIPALPLFAMAGGRAVVEILAGWRTAADRRGWRRLILTASLVGLLVSHGVPLAKSPLTSGWKAARRLLETPSATIAASAEPPIFALIDRLPADARLLLLNTNQGFFSRREYLADSFFEASQISHWLTPFATPREVRGALRQRGISHILLDRQPRPVTYPATLLSLLRDPNLVHPAAQSPDGRFLIFTLQ